MKLAMPQSRKLSGLVLTVGALMLVLLFGAIFWAIWGVPTELFISIGGLITGSGTQGTALAIRLARDGHRIRTLSRGEAGRLKLRQTIPSDLRDSISILHVFALGSSCVS